MNGKKIKILFELLQHCAYNEEYFLREQIKKKPSERKSNK